MNQQLILYRYSSYCCCCCCCWGDLLSPVHIVTESGDCRRKRRENGDSRRIRRRRQSHFCATVAVFCDSCRFRRQIVAEIGDSVDMLLKSLKACPHCRRKVRQFVPAALVGGVPWCWNHCKLEIRAVLSFTILQCSSTVRCLVGLFLRDFNFTA